MPQFQLVYLRSAPQSLGTEAIYYERIKALLEIGISPYVAGAAPFSAVEIIAKFPHDNGAYSQILLGLGGKAQMHWKINIDSSNGRAWLEY